VIEQADILDAEMHLHSGIRKTPFLDSRYFSQVTGADVWLLNEAAQRTGSYKIRGAWNAMRKLSPTELGRGVITASAGNHAQGVALAAKWIGCKATIVMPLTTPLVKVDQTRSYNSPAILLYGENYDEAAEHAAQLQRKTGATYIHPFDNDDVIAGQGTVGLHILRHHSDVETIIVPVGGGGLISGICVAIKAVNRKISIIGVNASGAASAARSFREQSRIRLDNVNTIADGIRVQQIGERTFDIISKYVDDVLEVSDDQICEALLLLEEKPKLIIEPAGATGVAALLASAERFARKKTMVVLTGANVDFSVMQKLMAHAMRLSGRLTTIEVQLADNMSSLAGLTKILADAQGIIISIDLRRNKVGMPLERMVCMLDLQARSSGHMQEILDAMRNGDMTFFIV